MEQSPTSEIPTIIRKGEPLARAGAVLNVGFRRFVGDQTGLSELTDTPTCIIC